MFMDVYGCLWMFMALARPGSLRHGPNSSRRSGFFSAVPWFFFVRKPAKNMRENIAETWGNHGKNPRKIGFTIAKLRRVIGKMWRTNRTEHPLNCLKLTLRLTKFWVVENGLPAPSSAGSKWGNEHIGNMVEQMLQ
jgi:hypothetical protein